MENGLGEDQGLAQRLSTTRVPGGPVAWARHRALAAVWLCTVAGPVGLVVRACRRWEAAERAGRKTPWPIDPLRV